MSGCTQIERRFCKWILMQIKFNLKKKKCVSYYFLYVVEVLNSRNPGWMFERDNLKLNLLEIIDIWCITKIKLFKSSSDMSFKRFYITYKFKYITFYFFILPWSKNSKQVKVLTELVFGLTSSKIIMKQWKLNNKNM